MLSLWIKDNFMTVLLVGIVFVAVKTLLEPYIGHIRIWNVITMFACGFYLFALYHITLGERTERGYYSYNLQPFWSYVAIIRDNQRYLIEENFQNIMAFLPMGVFLKDFLGERIRWYHALGIGCIVSSAIEISQLVFRLGLFEFDDIIHNSLGALAGYGILVVIRFCSSQIHDRKIHN